jgi:hypothetical protein
MNITRSFKPANLVFFLYGCVIIGSLWLCRNYSIYALNEGYDSLRYLGMAETLLKGEWLGEYNYLTLIRLPGYSFFLALNSWVGWPLHVSQQSLYLLSILGLAAALRTCQLTRLQAFLVFTCCAFHPIAFYPGLFIATEAIYTSLTTGVLAGCLGLLGSIGGGTLIYSLWLIVTSFCLAAFWYTRLEAIWILPVLGIFVLLLFLYARQTCPPQSMRVSLVRIALALAVPIVATLSLGGAIASLNEQHYGIRVTHELAEPNFVDFGRWLSRLAPEIRRPYVPVSSRALDASYKVSPHTALLKPFLSQQTGGRGWSGPGCKMTGICDELIGGWSMWALRDAVNSIGYYGSAKQASAFYEAAANEIATACKEGKIRCSDNLTGNLLAPAITFGDGARLLKSFWRMSVHALTFKDIADKDIAEGFSVINKMKANPGLVKRYERVTHDQNPQPPWNMESICFHFSIYTWIQLIGVGMLAIRLPWNLVRGSWHQNGNTIPAFQAPTAYGAVAILALVLIGSRIALVSYIDAMSFPSQLRYLFVIYPALIALAITAFPMPLWLKS